MAPVDVRIAMCRKLIKDRRMIVTGFERHLPNAFTANTIAQLVVQRPATHFVWIMGGDSLVHFHHWHKARWMFNAIAVAVVDRPGWRLPALASRTAAAYARSRIPERYAGLLPILQPPAWIYLTAPQNDVSSSEIRQN